LAISLKRIKKRTRQSGKRTEAMNSGVRETQTWKTGKLRATGRNGVPGTLTAMTGVKSAGRRGAMRGGTTAGRSLGVAIITRTATDSTSTVTADRITTGTFLSDTRRGRAGALQPAIARTRAHHSNYFHFLPKCGVVVFSVDLNSQTSYTSCIGIGVSEHKEEGRAES